MKMIEATSIKTIEEIISQVEDITPKVESVKAKIVNPEPIIEKKVIVKEEIPAFESNITEEIMENIPETKIEEVTPADKILIETTSMVDLSVIDSIPEVSYPTPFDDLPTTKEEAINLEEKPKPSEIVSPSIISSEIKVEAIVEEHKEVNAAEEVEVIPLEEPEMEEKNELYEQLTSKVYDRDYSLGECFELNFIFNGYENNKLSIISYAKDEDRKFLYKHFALIRTFAQDVYGNDVELDFKKEEASTDVKKNIESNPKEEVEESNLEDTGSMIEEVEMSSG